MTVNYGQLLLDEVRRYPAMLVAFSGGADSALMLAAAGRALGPDRVVAATVVSPSLATGELAAARDFAHALDLAHICVVGSELDRPGYVRNARDRCAHCKTELMEVLAPEALRLLGPDAVVATGTNTDDAVDPNRPGIAAAAQHGAVTPLAAVGLSKIQIREISRAWGLTTWDKPQAACLASRVAYGVPVTAAGLRRIDLSEAALRALFAATETDVTNLRVRDLGNDRASVEVDLVAVGQVSRLAEQLEERLLKHGFCSYEIDPNGFRSGSMNGPVLVPLRVSSPGSH